MNSQLKTQLKKPFNMTIMIFFILIIGAYIFTQYNAQFYKTPIGQITDITNKTTEQTVDQNKNKDTLHKEQIELKVLNGKHKGDNIQISHKYTDSLTDSEKYHKNDQVLLSYKGKEDTAIIKGLKRDGSVILMTGLFLLTLLLVGRKSGLYSIISLIINVTVLLFMIDYFMKYNNHHFFVLMTATVIFSTIVSLLLVSGFKRRTFVAIISTLLGTFLSIGISQLVMMLTNSDGIKYETMSFLTIQPTQIFLASVLIGSLGAVMDVAITLTSSLYEIKAQYPSISLKQLRQSGINIGKDIMGTMTNILFFAYLSGSIPMVILYFKNSNTVTYTLSMNWSLEITRALMGGIGIVITIPITIFVAMIFLQREEANR
ncbi:YibE/F family protein [Mammaliicoccus vitulinus]|uniref:YibE/F family protein n=1 Tax=Mammaliicoccus vitulinus TaxID=71237 RepID=UPI003BA3CE0D